MPAVWSRVAELLNDARRDGLLGEPEGLDLLDAIGLATPARRVVPRGARLEPAALDAFPGDRIVLKVVAPDVAHKSDAGGVRIVPREPRAVEAVFADFERRFGERLTGVLVEERVPIESGPGGELLLGLRWTDDFGPIVSLGPGGVHAEFLSGTGGAGIAPVLLSPDLPSGATGEALLNASPLVAHLTRPQRGEPPRVALSLLVEAVRRFLELAARHGGDHLVEFEVNPLAVSGGRLVALDALGRLTASRRPAPPRRPVGKMRHLFTPRKVAVVGVSERMNPGRIIVRNLLREGFDPEAITIVKPEATVIDGCRCVPDLAALPGPVDLCVLAVSAAQAPGAIAEIVERRAAESVIVIPGGLEEKSGSVALVTQLKEILAAARETAWQGPVLCGGNSLGLRSLPGRIDTLFIPEAKLPLAGPPAPVALISNSGAFAVARAGQLGGLNPRYIVTAGNQMDLTIGDYLTFLADDPEVAVFAVYVEGFRPLDGARFLAAARAIRESGRRVVLYRAGRTREGAAASASHTAAIAGDYAVTRALARQAGVLVAETLDAFTDLVRGATRLAGRRAAGVRLGALTNAGFECVGLADNLGGFRLAEFSESTRAALQALFTRVRIDGIVDVHNPLDLTPMADDAAYEEAARLLLADPGVDVAIVSCVPLSAALKTAGAEIEAADGVVMRLLSLHAATTKPWVAVVDGGPLFDRMALRLEEGGVPTFRSVDRALRTLGALCADGPGAAA